MNLWPCQIPNVDAICHALEGYGICADTSATGTGKTVMALHAAKRLNKEPVVICPKSVVPSWSEAMEALDVAGEAVNYERVLTSARKGGPETWGRWKRKGQVWEWDDTIELLIFDEAHRLNGPKSQTSKLLKAAKDQEIPTLLLSATLADSPLKMRAIGYALDLCRYEWRQWQSWCLMNGCAFGNFNQVIFTGSSEFRAKIMQGIRGQIGDRLTGVRADALDLPPNQIIVESVPVDRKDMSEHRAVLEELKEDAKTDAVAAARAWQISEWAKRQAIVERASDAMDSGNSVVIFTHFRATGEHVAEALGAAFIHGTNRGDYRRNALANFQAGHSRALVVMIQAGGEGINLHDTTGDRPRVSIVCPTHNPIHLIQALGRCHRGGSKSRTVQYILFAQDSGVEDRIKKNVSAKTSNIAALTANDLDIMPRITKTKTTYIPPKKKVTTPTEANHQERKHAKNSPSKLKNLEICAHYESRENDKDHPNTIRGTRCHEALEDWVNGVDHPLSPEDSELVELCKDYACDVLGTSSRDPFGSWQVWAEPKLETHERNTYGFADLVARKGNEAHIFDWKFGENYQGDADKNIQGQAYVIGAGRMLPGLTKITVHFIYPLLLEVTRHEYKPDDLQHLQERISKINRRTENLDNEPRHYVAYNCEYCGGRLKCPVWTAALDKVATVATHEETRLVPPPTLDLAKITKPEDMAKFLDIASYISDVLTEAKQCALAMVDEGKEIPGWRKVESTGHISHIEDAEGACEVASKFGVTQSDVMDCAKISAAQLAKKARAYAKRGEKQQAEEELRAALVDEGLAKVGESFAYLKRNTEGRLALPEGELN